jgi:hypothetical protein
MRTEVTDRELADIAERTGMKLAWLEAVARRIRSGDVLATSELVEAIARRASLRKDALALAERAVIVAELREPSAGYAGGAGLQVVEVREVPGLES